MSIRVILEERAKKDIREAARWIAQYSPDNAALWHLEIEEAILSLENFPNRCPLAPEDESFSEEIRHLLFRRYRILFTVRDEEVHILHVRHGAMDSVKPDDAKESEGLQ